LFDQVRVVDYIPEVYVEFNMFAESELRIGHDSEFVEFVEDELVEDTFV
jgi:hypothetical protein